MFDILPAKKPGNGNPRQFAAPNRCITSLTGYFESLVFTGIQASFDNLPDKTINTKEPTA
ncbi:hypothetical protein A1353_12910 [Methylomonas methanica]|uniref:Uncharacterized protein n=1 Tax=Methylomonas methanica TaxID=421 RepID=A0A177MH33_METMH|nr:hypothetical protein A1353_12910 [Methylomonas methanica]